MKGILLILGLVFAPLAISAEMVRYSGQLEGAPLEMVQEVIGRSGNVYKIQTTTTYQGQRQVSVEDLDEESFATREDGELMIAYCTQIGGVLEQMRNMPACKLPLQAKLLMIIQKHLKRDILKGAGLLWVGVVPITGMIALKQEGLSLELEELRW